jgi:hypothetical protein
MIMGTSVEHGTRLERTSKFSAKTSINRIIVNHGFVEECSKLIARRKQAKLQGLQDTSEVNEDNLSNVRREASGDLRNKRGDILKTKLIACFKQKTNIRVLYRGITENIRSGLNQELTF